MGKKIAMGIFSGITVIGLVLIIIGFSFGGRWGSFTVSEGRFVYRTSKETVPLVRAPYWLEDDDYLDWNDHLSLMGSGKEGETFTAPSASEVQKVNINITAGHVIITTGDTPAIKVDGPLECTTWLKEGTWNIESKYHGISVPGKAKEYWLDGEEVTTTYYITLPKELNELDVEFEIGNLTAENLSVNIAEFSTDMGKMTLNGIQARQADFSTNMGHLEIKDFEGAQCDLDVDMGDIEFSGNVTSSLEADCDMGSIHVVLAKPGEYMLESECDLGSIRVDGQRQNNTERTFTTDGAGNPIYISLSCGIGSINVDFE